MVKCGFLLRASLTALTSLVEFTPGIKHFGFTFSFNTSSSSRVVCYTFNCSSFEFSSPCLVPLQHQYLVILLLLLIANTCQLFQRRKLWHWVWGRGSLQRRFTCVGKPSENESSGLPKSSPRFPKAGLRQRLPRRRCRTRQGCSGELLLPPPRCSAGHKQIPCI